MGEFLEVEWSCLNRLSFDRGFGKAAQPIEGSMTYGVSQQLSDLFKENAGNTLGAEIARRPALPPPNGEKPH